MSETFVGMGGADLKGGQQGGPGGCGVSRMFGSVSKTLYVPEVLDVPSRSNVTP